AVGSGRRADHQVDVDGINTGTNQSLARGGNAHIGGELTLLGDMALFDASALPDPLVAGLHDAREVVVGYHPLGQIGADATDHRSNDRQLAPRSRRSMPMRRSCLLRLR